MAEHVDSVGSELSRREFVAAGVVAGAALAAPGLSPARFSTALAAEPAVTAAITDDALIDVALSVNGKDHALKLDPRATLLDTLRETLGLTGSKKGCDHGQCGACTVLVDDARVLSCLCFAAAVAPGKVTTIEGLAAGDPLHPLQQAFVKHDAFQCGFCTPGQICSGVALIKEGRCKTDADIREQMSGNLCRCGAYVNIVAAVKEAMAAKV